jgi:hypothetical protein
VGVVRTAMAVENPADGDLPVSAILGEDAGALAHA